VYQANVVIEQLTSNDDSVDLSYAMLILFIAYVYVLIISGLGFNDLMGIGL
jgi:hypothetical protein